MSQFFASGGQNIGLFMEGEFSLLEVLGDSRLRLQALVYTPESLESRDLMDGGVSIQEEPISSLTFSLES